MKKFFISLLILFIILIIALFIFLLTFDVNRYKGILIEKIERAIDKDVSISNISLDLLPRISLRLDGFSIKPVLKISSIEANINPLPLLKREIEIPHITIRGLRINILEDGFGIKTHTPSGSSDMEQGVMLVGGLSFLAKSLKIMDSSVHLEWEKFKEPVEVDIIEANFKNLSIYGPIDIDANLSIFGRGKENLRLKGILYPEIEDRAPYIRNLELLLELGKIDLSKIVSVFGIGDNMKDIVTKEFSGKLTVSSEKVFLAPKRILDSVLYASLSKGYTDILPIKGKLDNIEIDAEFNNRDLVIKNFRGSLAGGAISGNSKIKDVFLGQSLDVGIVLENMDVLHLLPERSLRDVSFEGILNLEAQASGRGLYKDKLIDTLTSEGKAKLDRAVLRNLNILVSAFEKLDMIPGLVQKLKNNLPGRYQEILKEKDTKFKPMEVNFKLRGGKIFFQDFLIESDSFYLVTRGSLGMDRYLDMEAQLFIPPELTDAFIKSVDVLKYLKDPKGMITMPLTIEGQIPDAKVMPDLNYVIQKLAVSKGQELLGDIFRKSLPSSSSPQSQEEPSREKEPQIEGDGQTETPQKQPEPEEIIIKTIFDILSPQQQKE